MQKGLFITFEGGEGAGKTTLIEEIEKTFRKKGHSVLKTREPGGTKLGEEIRSLLLEHKEPISPFSELCLFLASRAQHIQEVIRPALKKGKVVLCDRFNDSSIAYQGAARGLGVREVKKFCKFISEDLKPELTFYLDLDPKVGLKRASNIGAHDRIESEAIEFHKKIRSAFLRIHRNEPKRFMIVDASLSPHTVFQTAMKTIDHIFRHV